MSCADQGCPPTLMPAPVSRQCTGVQQWSLWGSCCLSSCPVISQRGVRSLALGPGAGATARGWGSFWASSEVSLPSSLASTLLHTAHPPARSASLITASFSFSPQHQQLWRPRLRRSPPRRWPSRRLAPRASPSARPRRARPTRCAPIFKKLPAVQQRLGPVQSLQCAQPSTLQSARAQQVQISRAVPQPCSQPVSQGPDSLAAVRRSTSTRSSSRSTPTRASAARLCPS